MQTRSCVIRSSCLKPFPEGSPAPPPTSHSLPGFCLPPSSDYTLDVSYSRRPSQSPPKSSHNSAGFSISPTSAYICNLTSLSRNSTVRYLSYTDVGKLWLMAKFGPWPMLKDPWDKNAFSSFKDWGKKIGKEKNMLRVCMWPAQPQTFTLWLESLALMLPTVCSLRARKTF